MQVVVCLMTNTSLESEIVDLLSELSSVQDELLEVLTQKRDFMANTDIPAMQQLEPRQQQLAARLQQCHDRRRALLDKAAQEGHPADSIGQLAAGMPPDIRDRLTKRVQESSARTRLLQHQSLSNWVLAQRSLLHLSQLLEIVATGGRIQPTYGKSESEHLRGGLVDEAV